MPKKKQIKKIDVVKDDQTSIEEVLEESISVPTTKTIYDELVELIGSEIELNKYPEYDDMYLRLKGKRFENSCEECKPRMLYSILKIYVKLFNNKQIKAEDYV